MTGYYTYLCFVTCLLAFVAAKYGWLVEMLIESYYALMSGL